MDRGVPDGEYAGAAYRRKRGKNEDIMDDGSNPIAGCIIFLIFILLNGIAYGFGTAIQQVGENEVKKEAAGGDKRSAWLLRMLERPAALINTILVVSTLLSIISGFFLIHSFSGYVYDLLQMIPFASDLNSRLVSILASVLVVLAGLILLLAFGILIPKKICAHHADRAVYVLLKPICFLVGFFRPVVAATMGLANLVVRLLGMDPHKSGDDVTEDEIIGLVDEAHEQGVIQESEAEMIQNIMEFSDKDAKDIMTHRKNIEAFDEEETLGEVVDRMLEGNNSRYPVYSENIDNIQGIIHFKDAMYQLTRNSCGDRMLKEIPGLIRTVGFIPETRSIDNIFKAMQSKKAHMAVVVDEYGQTAGIVTMEDILEEIVGDILDEYDENDDYIQPQYDDSILMDGLTPLDQVGAVLNADFSDIEEFETLNGYLTSLLGHIPTRKDREVEARGFLFQILSVEHNTIQKVRVEKLQEKEGETDVRTF